MIEKLNPEHEIIAAHMAATTAAFQVRSFCEQPHLSVIPTGRGTPQTFTIPV